MSESMSFILQWGGMVLFLAVIFRTIAYLLLRGQKKRKSIAAGHEVDSRN